MIAVVKTGGKQYIVKKDDILDIEKIEGEKGSKISLEDVLLIDDGKDLKIGNPVIEKSKVEIEIIDQFKDKKVIIQKFKRKTGYRVKKGHRQQKTKVKVLDIKY
uniref:Large ribosomal subunit protein bL21 n=1 Tax=candidate division CPR3 bacterium TaxID=2268181 RepID=A0A7C4QWY2_UNCC3